MVKVRIATVRRISGHRDQKKGISLKTQADQMHDFAAKNNGVVVLELEHVKSGWRLTDADYQTIKDAARQGKIDAVLMYRLDRFGRNNGQAIQRCDELEFKYGVRIWSVTQGVDVPKLQRDIWFTMAAEESRATSERTADNMRTMVLQGRWPGPPPLGYELDHSRTAIDGLPVPGYIKPKEPGASVVREMFRRAAHGESAWSITQWLNTEHPHLRPNGWLHQSVLWVLRNPVYMGDVAYDRRSNGNFAPHGKKASERHLRVKGQHAPLVDAPLFERVQERLLLHRHLTTRSANEATHSRKHVLDGLVRCGVCGRKATLRATGQSRQSIWYVFKCKEPGHTGVGARGLLAHVVSTLENMPLTAEALALARTQLEAERAMPRIDRRTRLLAEKRSNDAALDNLGIKLAHGTIDDDRYVRLAALVQEELARIEAELADCPVIPDQRALLAQAQRYLTELGAVQPIIQEALQDASSETLDLVAEALAHTMVRVLIRKGQDPEIIWQPWVTALRQAQEARPATTNTPLSA